MKFSKKVTKVAESLLTHVESAVDKVIEKTESLDDAIEKRKIRHDAEKEFSTISSRVIENLINLTDEEFENLPDIIKVDVEKLYEAVEVIAEVDEEILADKGCKSCYNCDEVIDENSKYCPECGTYQDVEIEVESNDFASEDETEE